MSLTKDLLHELFEYRDGKLFWKVPKQRVQVGGEAGFLAGSGYVRVYIDRKAYLAHRLIWLMHHGYLPKEIDHINRDPADNRIENLRSVTHAENEWNRSRVKGYIWAARVRKWEARIVANGVFMYLGAFSTETEAHAAYLAAKAKHHIIVGSDDA